MVRHGARVERYSMGFDDTAEIPFGLGCGGTVDLLYEPVDSAEGEALRAAWEASLGGMALRVVSFLPDERWGLRRLVLGADGAVVFASAGLTEEKVACARGLVPGTEYEGRFVEEMLPPHRLFVLGAGEDARPVVELAASVGFAVTVADGRSQWARAERFPGAERVIALGAGWGEGLGITEADAVVVMTHRYDEDRAMLVATLPVRPLYLGLLGARHRSSLLVSEAAAMLGLSVAECCERLFAPVGMDLGGDGPSAIALAIVAEIHAVMHGKLGSQLRLTAEDVAEHVARGGASRYLQAQCAVGA